MNASNSAQPVEHTHSKAACEASDMSPLCQYRGKRMVRVFGASAERGNPTAPTNAPELRSSITHRKPQPSIHYNLGHLPTPHFLEHPHCPNTCRRPTGSAQRRPSEPKLPTTWPLDRVTWSGSARGMGPAQGQLHVSGPSPRGVPEDAERTLTRATPGLACQHQLLGRRARCVAPSATQRTRRTETRGVLRLREYTTALMAVILPSALIQPCCTQRR